MQSAVEVEVEVPELGGRWTTRLLSGNRALRRLFRIVSHELTSESLESTVARAVEQAFAEFAREMGG
jgi:hypothetical protein